MAQSCAACSMRITGCLVAQCAAYGRPLVFLACADSKTDPKNYHKSHIFFEKEEEEKQGEKERKEEEQEEVKEEDEEDHHNHLTGIPQGMQVMAKTK